MNYISLVTRQWFNEEWADHTRSAFILLKVGSGFINTRYTLEQVKGLFDERGCTLLENHYTNNKQPLSYLCACGKASVIKLNTLLNGGLCKICGYKKSRKTNTKTHTEVVEVFAEKGFKLISDSYEGSRLPLRYICKCGRESVTSLSNIGSIQGCRDCWLDIMRSDESPYRSLSTEERHAQRKAPEYAEWRTQVFQIDSYSCVKCTQHGGSLEAHHLDAFHWCEDRRYDTTNGVTLCKTCHADFHRVYGKRLNTEKQFDEWIEGGGEKSA